ncbi:MAG: winged helix-turn-helix domain-containing protein [Bacteroidia bacterium]|jgi:predicted transcriptional regulator|nr:winged helix-turn-helix domain-containing protein [Bacteroidia bacterium]
MIEALISSKTRIKLLLKFFLNSSNQSYLRGLESEFGESTNGIRLELNKLEEAGLLTTKIDGNKKFFQANANHPLFNDIHNILLKFTGLDKVIEKVIENLGQLQHVFLVGQLAKGLSSEVIDLVFVGDIDKNYLFNVVQKVEVNLNKKIRFVSYLDSEYNEEKFAIDYPDYLLLWSK